ncbi:MAG: hypothetical protein HON76_00230 [Candidatus Scalindua sp.]|jgi:hypothetical protein|nr:hypothetical protein [Candidatus Scalindua sp.]MBT6560938.1 hypothetical protein [Candidatus Scalindua sp.]MBT7350111.1 hypothetical protein [candidate division WWE3 bacterium]
MRSILQTQELSITSVWLDAIDSSEWNSSIFVLDTSCEDAALGNVK